MMMKYTKIALLFCGLMLLCSCNLFENKKAGIDFLKCIIAEDYTKAIQYMPETEDTNEIKEQLKKTREYIVKTKGFGTNLDYSFISSKKELLATSGEYTEYTFEFYNDDYVGLTRLLFEDESSKIVNIYIQDFQKLKPSMFAFYLISLLAICIPAFNIYMIRRVKRSDLKKKWLKYLAIILLNVPAISYSAVNGFDFNLLSFQVLLGISFSYAGYLNSICAVGIPLGGLYWYYKLNNQEFEDELTEEIEQENNSTQVE